MLQVKRFNFSVDIQVLGHRRIDVRDTVHRTTTRGVELLLLLAVLGASVLEPNLYLTLGQLQGLRQFGFASNCDVARVVEFFFEFESLMVGVYDSVFVLGSSFAWKEKMNGFL